MVAPAHVPSSDHRSSVLVPNPPLPPPGSFSTAARACPTHSHPHWASSTPITAAPRPTASGRGCSPFERSAARPLAAATGSGSQTRFHRGIAGPGSCLQGRGGSAVLRPDVTLELQGVGAAAVRLTCSGGGVRLSPCARALS
ncbi:hypothetical protein NN561_010572 [Cricetulus griseus]